MAPSLRTLTVAAALAFSDVAVSVRVTSQRRRAPAGAGHFPALCEEGLVQATCDLFSGGSTAEVSARQVQSALSASTAAVSKLWTGMGLGDSSTGAISCKKLCRAAADYFQRSGELPPTSDVGCRATAGGRICDVDLRPSALRSLIARESEMSPEVFKQGNKELPGDAAAPATRPDSDDLPALSELKKLPSAAAAVEALEHVQAGAELVPAVEYFEPRDLARRVANMFRIYPDLDVQVSKASAGAGVGSLLQRSASQALPAELEAHVKKQNQLAQVYMSLAIMQFQGDQTEKLVAKWFGKDTPKDDAFLAEIRRVLNSIANVLSNVEYVYPGELCNEDTFAYVIKRGPEDLIRNEKGEFKYYLCDTFFAASAQEQLETLVHESSHHQPAYTDDVCLHPPAEYAELPLEELGMTAEEALGQRFGLPADDAEDGEEGQEVQVKVVFVKGDVAMLEVEGADCMLPAYERPRCLKLAELDPIRAVRNADNYCFFVHDVAAETIAATMAAEDEQPAAAPAAEQPEQPAAAREAPAAQLEQPAAASSSSSSKAYDPDNLPLYDSDDLALYMQGSESD